MVEEKSEQERPFSLQAECNEATQKKSVLPQKKNESKRSDIEAVVLRIFSSLMEKEQNIQEISVKAKVNYETTHRYLLMLQKIGLVKATVKYSLKFDKLKLLQGSVRENTLKEFEQKLKGDPDE